MLVPLHQLIGTLAATLTALANSATLDAASYSLLRSKVVSPDWTYLAIQSGSLYEIVKVTSVNDNGTVTINRGESPTTAQAFPIGATVTFIMGESAIADLIAEHQLGSFAITGSGSVTVTQLGPLEFQIYSPVVSLSGTDGITVSGSMETGFVVSLQNPIPCCPGSE